RVRETPSADPPVTHAAMPPAPVGGELGCGSRDAPLKGRSAPLPVVVGDHAVNVASIPRMRRASFKLAGGRTPPRTTKPPRPRVVAGAPSQHGLKSAVRQTSTRSGPRRVCPG